MGNDDQTSAAGDELGRVRGELRRHEQDAEEVCEDLRRRTWTVLLGAAGIAQWILLALPWFTLNDDEVIDGQLSGWGLLLAGLEGVADGDGGSDKVLAVIVGIMPPVACLVTIALIWWHVVNPTRPKADATQFASIIAGLGFVGLYVALGGFSNADPTFAAPMFAAMTLWFATAAIGWKGYERR